MSWILPPLALWLAWAGFLFVVQRRVLFPGAGPRVASAPLERVPGLQRLWLAVPGGEVEAWFIPPRGPTPAPALVFTHGNGELIDDWVTDLADFAERGLGVMLVEYPGYGRSGGRPTAATLLHATRAAYDALAGRPGIDPARIVAHGRSLGGGPAALLSLERPLAALVLESTFTGLAPFTRRWLVPSFLLRDRFDVLGAVRAFPGPVLVLHGRRDAIVPFSHGERLAAANPRASLHPWDCAHNDCPPSWSDHVRTVTRFLEREGVLR